MQKFIALFLMMVCVFGSVGCHTNDSFDDFSDLEEAFEAVVQFVLKCTSKK